MDIEVDLDSDSEVLQPEEPKQLVPAEEAIVTVRPQMEAVLSDAAALTHASMATLAAQIGEQRHATPEQMRLVAVLVDAVTKLSREDRQRSAAFEEGLGSMDDDELDKLLEDVE